MGKLKYWSILLLLLPGLSHAVLKVVSTSTSTGSLVREVGGDQVHLTILAPPDRDLHQLQARPSMMRQLRRADLLVALGADLEIGWLPVAIKQSANPKILPGKAGYFEATAQVQLIDAGGEANRALGDVHPVGNPHVNMDPILMAQVARALAQRLAQLDPANADEYAQRAAAFHTKVQMSMQQWQEDIDFVDGAVLYHKDAAYLLRRFRIPLLGLIEPVPGVPPSGSHLKALSSSLKDQNGVILFTSYQSKQAPEKLAQILGWNTRRLPLEPPLEADGDGYLAHMDLWVRALAADSK